MVKCSCDGLTKKDDRLWKKQNIESGNDIYPYLGAPLDQWIRYNQAAKTILMKCGYSKKKKVPDKIRACLEDKNYHSLNQVIDFVGFGTKRYGLTSKDFFKRRKR